MNETYDDLFDELDRLITNCVTSHVVSFHLMTFPVKDETFI